MLLEKKKRKNYFFYHIYINQKEKKEFFVLPHLLLKNKNKRKRDEFFPLHVVGGNIFLPIVTFLFSTQILFFPLNSTNYTTNQTPIRIIEPIVRLEM